MPVGELMRAVAQRTLDRKREWYGQDICDIWGPQFVESGSSSDSFELALIVTGVECLVSELSGAQARTVSGGEAYESTHRVEMQRDEVTEVITPQYQLRVRPRDGIAERVFQKPVAPAESFTPTMVFKTVLVRQGFSQ